MMELEFEEMLEAEKNAEKFPAIRREAPETALKQFDTSAVIAELSAMEEMCTALVGKAQSLEIKSKKENMDAVNISGKLQELGKAVKKKCEDFLSPYKKVTSSVNGPKKRIIDAATSAKGIINQKIAQYKKQEEIEQARQQKLIDAASEKLQEDLNKQAAEVGIEAPVVAPIKAPKPVSVLRGDSGAAVFSQKRWKCEIVDPEKVERKYCEPSMKLLNQAVKMGKRNIAGCRVYQKESTVTRTA